MRNSKDRIAIITLTRKGAELGRTLRLLLEGSDLYVPAHRAAGIAEAHTFDAGVREVVEHTFNIYDRLLLVFSLGIAVRVVARCLYSKAADPAVVVMDEKGRFAISVLSGHVGGANDFARQVAELTGAIPVITTASDVNSALAIDLLGKEHGWEIENWANVTRTSAAVVNDETLGVFQDAGEPWWATGTPLPSNTSVFQDLDTLQHSDVAAALIVTDRLLNPGFAEIISRAVVYRPKSLVVGLGCNRGTSAEEIDRAVRRVLDDSGLSFRSIRNLATIDIKDSEVGLLEFARRHGLRIAYLSAGELEGAKGVLNPSERVRRSVGCRSVCEAAALLSAGSSQLIVPKTKVGNVTAAVARLSPSP